jgi:hypothetical protein
MMGWMAPRGIEVPTGVSGESPGTGAIDERITTVGLDLARRADEVIE